MTYIITESKLHKVSSAALLDTVIEATLIEGPTRDRLNAICAYANYSSDCMTTGEQKVAQGNVGKLLMNFPHLFEMNIPRELRHYAYALYMFLTSEHV